MENRPVILFPTMAEAAPFTESYDSAYLIRECGIGLAECAASTAGAIAELGPAMLILAGTAGAYPGSGVSKGDTVIVTREYSHDLGAMRGEVFEPINMRHGGQPHNYYDCPTPLPEIFRKAASNSVNTAAMKTGGHGPAQIENMEGSAFFAVCLALGVPFAEIRTVSNIVGEPPAQWIFREAVGKLAEDLDKFIRNLGQ